jgi:YhcH/YjgK/YiaL family protein
MIFDATLNWRQYSSLPAWASAFAWIEAHAATAAPGEHEILGRDIYAVVFEFDSKNLLDAPIEAHREYMDIHAPLPAPHGGAEVQARFGLEELEEKDAYDPARDAADFHHPDRFRALFTVHPGQFAAYFPQDAHLTQGKTGPAPERLRKVVVKVRAALLQP